MKLNRIKAVLEEKGISQTWLSKKMGKSFSTVNAYVCNRTQPNLTTLLEIAQIYLWIWRNLSQTRKNVVLNKRQDIMVQSQYNFLFSFIWNIANDVLVNAFNKGDYKKVILPMLVLRRIDVLLEPTKDAVIQMKEQLDNKSFQNAINERVFQQVYSKVSQGL